MKNILWYLCSAIQGQYFLVPPSTAMTGAFQFWKMYSNSYCSSLWNTLNSVRLDGEGLWRAIFKSYQRFPIGLKSVLNWAILAHIWGLIEIFTLDLGLYVKYFYRPYWKVKLCYFQAFGWLTTSFFLGFYLSLSYQLLPATLTLLKKKHPKSMMLQTPCFPIIMV